MPKFEVGEKLLQVSAVPNTVCYTDYSKGPSIAEVIKITPNMYRLDFSGELHDVRIEEVEQNFIRWSEEKEKQLIEIYTTMRTEWSKLYKLQIDFLRSDK